MAVIRPFRGIRFDPSKAGSLEKVICPPYDVVDDAERKRLAGLSPHNLIRVELPQETPSVPATDEDYARAGNLLAEWEKSGVLVRDERPALYPYLQAYVGPDGKRRERRGFLCCLRVEDYDGGAVRPHEKTLPKPKEDRFKLLQATQTNVSPVFGLYDDKDGKVAEALAKAFVSPPIAEFTDAKGIEHRVWRFDEGEAQGTVRAALGQSRVYIADGHHRYETAIRYRNFRRDAEGTRPALGSAPYDYALAYLADVRDAGLAVFPIHRLAKLPAGMDAASLRTALERFFTVEEIAAVPTVGDAGLIAAKLEQAIGAGKEQPVRNKEKVFALYSAKLSVAWVLRSKETLATFLQQSGLPKPVAGLDVAALHRAILEETLKASYADGTVYFAHDAADAVGYTLPAKDAKDKAKSEPWDLAILCHATRVQELLSVVDAGETMPQKSTFFYPKPATGIVMNRVDE